MALVYLTDEVAKFLTGLVRKRRISRSAAMRHFVFVAHRAVEGLVHSDDLDEIVPDLAAEFKRWQGRKNLKISVRNIGRAIKSDKDALAALQGARLVVAGAQNARVRVKSETPYAGLPTVLDITKTTN